MWAECVQCITTTLNRCYAVNSLYLSAVKLMSTMCTPCLCVVQDSTALMAAAGGGHVEVVSMLLEAGAVVGNKNSTVREEGLLDRC